MLLRYTQDLAGVHSASRGFDRSWYAERGITWLVRAADVWVVEPIAVGAELVGTTTVMGWRRVWARRRTEFHDPNGVMVAWVHIDWVLLDDRGTPTRIPKEFDSVFGAPQATFRLARVDLGEVPPEPARSTVTVRPQELDPMVHVNNAVYADWLDEAVIAAGGTLAARAVPRLVRLEYARAAEPAASLVVDTWPDEFGWVCRVADADGSDLLRARLQPIDPTGSDGATTTRMEDP